MGTVIKYYLLYRSISRIDTNKYVLLKGDTSVEIFEKFKPDITELSILVGGIGIINSYVDIFTIVHDEDLMYKQLDLYIVILKDSFKVYINKSFIDYYEGEILLRMIKLLDIETKSITIGHRLCRTESEYHTKFKDYGKTISQYDLKLSGDLNNPSEILDDNYGLIIYFEDFIVGIRRNYYWSRNEQPYVINVSEPPSLISTSSITTFVCYYIEKNFK